MRLLSCSMWDLVPWPGVELKPPALGLRSLSHWTPREVPGQTSSHRQYVRTPNQRPWPSVSLKASTLSHPPPSLFPQGPRLLLFLLLHHLYQGPWPFFAHACEAGCPVITADITMYLQWLCVCSVETKSDSYPTSWVVACQAPLSMGFSRQEDWSGLPFTPPGDLPDSGIEPASLALAGRFLTTDPSENPINPPKSYHFLILSNIIM